MFPTQMAPKSRAQQIRPVEKHTEFTKDCQYYKVLDVPQNATTQMIRSSYFRLAKKFHPDVVSGEQRATNEKEFATLTEAYDVLSNTATRSSYDGFLMKTEKPKNAAEVSRNMSILLSKDILAEVKKSTLTKSPAPIERTQFVSREKMKIAPRADESEANVAEVTVPFMQAIVGQIQHVNLRLSASCVSCRKSVRHNCIACHGTGVIPVEKSLPIRIPSGVTDGQILTIQHPDKSGELKVRVKVEKHSLFVRDKLDILSTVNVPWLTGLLGGEITVKTIYGDIVPVSIRPGTNSHTTIRLEKMGVRSLHETGDHIVIVKIMMPNILSEQQKKLLLQYF